MKSQLKSFWFAIGSLGLLVLASAWVIGQERDAQLDLNTRTLREIGDAKHENSEEDADGDWNEEHREWDSGWDEDFENEETGERDRFFGDEDEFDEDFEDEQDEFDNEIEDGWRRDLDEEDYLEDEWNEEDEDCGDGPFVSTEDLEHWAALGKIAANSEKTALVAVQVASAYLEPEQAIQLLEDTVETTDNSTVKRLARLQLVELYAWQELPEQMREQLRQLILQH